MVLVDRIAATGSGSTALRARSQRRLPLAFPAAARRNLLRVSRCAVENRPSLTNVIALYAERDRMLEEIKGPD